MCRIMLRGWCDLGILSGKLECNNVFPITYILSLGSVGHILLRTEKSTRYLLVTYAVKREKQILIIE